MPHWKALGVRKCVRGTPGHARRRSSRPERERPSFRRASSPPSPRRSSAAALAGADTLLVAGVHLHGCVRATVLDAYARGLAVWVAEDAVGSDDPLHAAVTRRYLDGRAARFAPVDELLARVAAGAAPGPDTGRYAADGGPAHPPRPRRAASAWSAAAPEERARPAGRPRGAARGRGGRRSPARSRPSVGKPVTQGEAEVRRTAELLRRAAALRPPAPSRAGPDVFVSARPARRRRRRHSLEQPSRHPLGQDRPGAGSRQHGRLEAGPRRDHGSRSARSTRRATRGCPTES